MLGRDAPSTRRRNQSKRKAPTPVGFGVSAPLCVYRAPLIPHEEYASPVGGGVQHVILVLVVPTSGLRVDTPHLPTLFLGERTNSMDVRAAETVAKAGVPRPWPSLERS
jgi:hypothetical protein